MAKHAVLEDAPIMVATQSFLARYDGVDHPITAGVTRVRLGHPIMRGREHMFEPILAHYEVETASAAPGEVRGG